MSQFKFFDNISFNFEMIRPLGHSVSGSSDIMECIGVAERVSDGNFEDWYNEWFKVADRLYKYARESEEKGHMITAYSNYLRASNYFREAEFYIHENVEDPRILNASRLAVESFIKATRGFNHEVEYVKVPYEDTTLPAYFVKSSKAQGKAPVFIIMNGFDGTKEEALMCEGIAAADRGYHVLAFEGPGQGEVVREQKLYFRPDWEKVITPMIDYVLGRKDVAIDKDRIALTGLSMGGLLVGEAAQYEHRIKALICNSGLLNQDSWIEMTFGDAGKLAFTDPDEFNRRAPEWAHITGVKWFYDNGSMVFGAKDPADLVRKYLALRTEHPEMITAHTLVIDSEAEHFFKGAAQIMYDKLTCPKDYQFFTCEQGCQWHCQAGGELLGGQIIFDWLDELFGIKA